MNFGEKIRNIREDKDMLQQDVAKLIPMNQSNYSKIERGVQEPSMEQLKRICEILNIDPRYLLGLGKYEMLTTEDMRLLADVKDLIRKYQDEP